MAATYTSFLRSPAPANLSEKASIHYIPTTTTIKEPASIVKHLQAQLKQVKKNEEKILSTIEGSDGSLCLETETTLEFVNGGGAYLPGLDDNLLSDRVVTLPMVHIVHSDSNGKIEQIRIYWDQASLLRDVEAISSRNRNWPIKTGDAQVKLVAHSVKAASSGSSNGMLPARSQADVVISSHQKHQSVSAINDPHASLALFTPRDPNEDERAPSQGPGVATRESAKPAPREWGELFAGGEDEQDRARLRSPTKADGVLLKTGAGKHFTPNRIFDEGEPGPLQPSPERKKYFSQRNDHFEFGDGEDVASTTGTSRPQSQRSNMHAATFSFNDFATPPKAQDKPHPGYERHWGPDMDKDVPPSPPKRPVVHHVRPDAAAHFNLTDAQTPAAKQPKMNAEGAKHNNLYAGQIGGDDDDDATPRKNPLNTITNVNNNNRGGDESGAHYRTTDDPQISAKDIGKDSGKDENARPASKGGRPDIEQHSFFGTPEKEHKIYKTAGDGMGGRNGKSRNWGFGDDSDDESVTGKAGGSAHARNRSYGRQRSTQAGAGAQNGLWDEEA